MQYKLAKPAQNDKKTIESTTYLTYTIPVTHPTSSRIERPTERLRPDRTSRNGKFWDLETAPSLCTGTGEGRCEPMGQ
jgi:hypothetical protein